jgi:alkylation response protein AidB-like acyl-CoA dehydrogenase
MALNYDLNEEQQILRSSVRKFAEDVIKPVARELDEKEEFSYDTMKGMAEMGLFGVFVSPDYGGFGLDYVSYIIATEEIARVDGSHAATVAAGNSLGIGPLYYFGDEEQKKKYLPKLCSGQALWGFGLTEPDAGSDAGGSKTTAVQDGNEWVINGSKIFITNAANKLSLGVTVQAVTGKLPNGKKEISCFLVEHGTPGFTTKEMHGKLMWRSSNTAELYFEDCRVPQENLLGKQGEGFHQMLATLDGGRLSIGAMGQFGQPICKFQAVAFKLADMAMEIELARNLMYKAGWLRDNQRPFAKEAAMAKLYCSELARRVSNHAVQIHGGYGLMKEYDVERFYRDAKLLEIGVGTSEVQRIVISRQIGC